MSLDCHDSCWETTFGGKPIKEIDHKDYSADYEMDRMHVFELDNGKFATVLESGGSCYESMNAIIDLHPTKSSALSSMFKYKNMKGMSNLEYLEEKAKEEDNQ